MKGRFFGSLVMLCLYLTPANSAIRPNSFSLENNNSFCSYVVDSIYNRNGEIDTYQEKQVLKSCKDGKLVGLYIEAVKDGNRIWIPDETEIANSYEDLHRVIFPKAVDRVARKEGGTVIISIDENNRPVIHSPIYHYDSTIKHENFPFWSYMRRRKFGTNKY